MDSVNIINRLLHLLSINRFMPLFDSFQSCYKDNKRFFAGLCFVYRIAAFLTYVQNETMPPIFLAVIFLGVHSFLQPYKDNRHNIIDSLIYLDIAIINSFTITIKSLMKESSTITDSTTKFALIQLVFIYLPLLTLLLSLVIKLGRKVYSKYITKQMEQQDHQIVSNSTVSVITHTSVELQLSVPLLIEGTLNGDYT